MGSTGSFYILGEKDKKKRSLMDIVEHQEVRSSVAVWTELQGEPYLDHSPIGILLFLITKCRSRENNVKRCFFGIVEGLTNIVEQRRGGGSVGGDLM